MKQPANSKIVGGFNRKEKWAFEWIFKIYRPLVYELAARILKNDSDAEDVTMDAFVKLQQVTDRKEVLKDISDFLNRTAKNLSVDLKRKRQLEKNYQAHLADELPQITEAEMYRIETGAALYYEINRNKNKLSPLCDRIFNKYFMEQKSIAEIAQEIKISGKTVSNCKSRAVRIMKLEIGPRKSNVFFLTILP